MLSSTSQDRKRNSVAALAVGLSLIAILLIGAAPGRAVTTGTTYDNVQVAIHTTNSTFVGTYTVTAYNSTGYALVTYSTPYAAASFELPSGSYIFAVSADSQYPYACPLLTGASSGGGAVTGSTPPVTTATASSGSGSGSGSGTAVILPPCYYGYPASEYGFSVQQVSGPMSVTVSTQPVESFPTTTITVHVHYANGTAAAGTSLYASVLGGEWFGGYGASTVSMSGVTGSEGTAKMLVPDVPVQVTAWNWIPVKLPTGQSTVVVTIGGEKVNVSVNWQPSYVGLAGSVLIVPPQTTGSITLHVEQPTFWATPEGAQTVNSASAGTLATSGASSTPATVASSPDLVPASLTSQQGAGAAQTPAQTIVSTSTVFEPAQTVQATSPSVSTGGASYETVLLTIVGALALGIASASLIIVRRRPDV